MKLLFSSASMPELGLLESLLAESGIVTIAGGQLRTLHSHISGL
jgi:hypothetical protein